MARYRRRRPFTQADDMALAALFAQGLSASRIAGKLKRDEASVSKRAAELGVSRSARPVSADLTAQQGA
jgi:hypothetical protein